MAADSKTARGDYDSAIGCFVIVIAVIGWLVYSFSYAPSQKEEIVTESAASNNAEQLLGWVRLQLAVSIPDASPRLERFKGDNLDIYLTVREFQKVQYPDRREFIERIGKVWCDRVSKAFLPAVQFRDISTGQLFGSYGCLSKNVSLPD